MLILMALALTCLLLLLLSLSLLILWGVYGSRLCESDEQCSYLKVDANAYLHLPPYWAKVQVVQDALRLTSLDDTVTPQLLSAADDEPHHPPSSEFCCEMVLWLGKGPLPCRCR